MALKYQIDTTEGLDDTLKALYVEKDGKFTLDVEGVETPESVSGLKTALLKERENNAAFKKFGTPDEITASMADLRAQAAAPKGKPDNSEQEALVAQMQEKHQQEIAQKDQNFTSLSKKVTNAELKAELAKAGVLPEGMDMMATWLESRIKYNEDGSPKVYTADGEMPMIGSGKDGGATLADLAKEVVAGMPALTADSGKGGSGKPPNSSGGKPPENLKRADMGPLEKAEFIKAKGVESYSALPE